MRRVGLRSDSFPDYLRDRRAKVDAELDAILPPANREPRALHRAMRYSVFAGGKRLRPVLCLIAGECAGGRPRSLLVPAAAIELVHTYSLIHDDLPCMDDDDFRRGRPSCHRAHGEGMAVLAGDALLTLAFETLARRIRDPRRAAGLVRELGEAAGPAGMVGGQARDLLAEGRRPTRRAVTAIHQGKTAALIAGSLRMGARAAGARSPLVDRLGRFGWWAGQAFQIADDLLDVRASRRRLGKTPGKDAKRRKMTYPALLGVERARREARRLAERAKAEVAGLPRADLLRGFADLAVQREA